MRKIVLVAAAVALLSGCSTTVLNTGNQVNLNGVDFKESFKVGEACETRVLIFGPFGSASVVDAAKNAGLSKVEIVEQSYKDYLLIGKRCTKVHGKG